MARSVLAWGQTDANSTSTTAATWFDVGADGGGSFTVDATFAGSTNYYVFWGVAFSSPDENTEHGFRLFDATSSTAVDSITTRIVANGTRSFFLPIRLTPGAVSKTYKIQANPGTSNGVTVKHAFIVILPEITGDQYAETAAGAATTSTTYASVRNLAWTAGTSEKYLIVGACKTQATSFNRVLVRVNDGSTTYGAPDHRLFAKSNIDYPISLVVNATLTGAQSWDLEHKTFDALDTVTTSDRRMVALLLDADAWSAESRTGSATTSATFGTKTSVTQTFDAVPHLVLGSMWLDSGSNNSQIGSRLTLDGAEAADSEFSNNIPTANVDVLQAVGWVNNVTTIASETVALQFSSPNATDTVNAYEAALVVIELSEGSATFGVDIEVDSGQRVEANGTRVEDEFVMAWGIRDDTAETLKLRVNGSDVATTSFTGQTPDAQSGDVTIAGPVQWYLCAGFKDTPSALDIADIEELFGERFRLRTTSASFSLVSGAVDQSLSSFVTDPSGAGWTVPTGDGTYVDVSSTGPDTSAEITPSATIGDIERGFARIRSANSLIADGFVPVEVRTIDGVGTYSNGYGYRTSIRIAADAIEGSLTQFVMLFDQTDNAYRTVANGGNVQSASGFDIRFEGSSGNKLPHTLEYDGTTGRIRAWVNVGTISGQRDIYLFTGFAGLAATEENRTGTFAGMLRAYEIATGADASGKGDDLTITGDVSGGDIGWPGGAFDGNDILQTDSGFMDGLNAIEFVFPFFQADSSMIGTQSGWFREFEPDANDSTGGVSARFMSQSFDGTLTNTMHFKVRRTDGSHYAITPQSSAVSDLQTLHMASQPGQTPVFYVDGVDRTTLATPVRSGALDMNTIAEVVGDNPQIGLQEIPAPLSTVDVTPSTFQSALRNAPAGRHLLTDDGFYQDLIYEAPNGTPENPIVIRPKDKTKPATFRNVEFNRNCRNVIVAGQIFDDRGYATSDEARCLEVDGTNMFFWYCQFRARGIAVATEFGTHFNVWFYRCSWDEQLEGSSGNGGEAVKAGGKSDQDRNTQVRITQCRFRNFNRDGESEVISIKGGDVTVEDVDIDNCKNIYCRHGNRAIIRRVRMPNSHILVWGSDHLIQHIIAERVDLAPGTREGDRVYSGDGAVYVQSRRCRVQQVRGELEINRAPFTVNQSLYTFPAIDHEYSDVDVLDNNGSNAVQVASIPYQEPPTYGADDVGVALYQSSVVGA